MKIYHNPRCSKSRAALAILEESGVAFDVVDYLKEPLTEAELSAIVKKLGLKPEELVRRGEAIYKEKYSGRKMSDVDWIRAMAMNPILIERPIVVRGNKAVLGRPPEKVQDLL